ncbi:hypothetical protein DRB07_07020 [Actinomyces sp. Z3]|nr:hypothetical protein DRB07_07020 [Actinomyces sp. Z3]
MSAAMPPGAVVETAAVVGVGEAVDGVDVGTESVQPASMGDTRPMATAVVRAASRIARAGRGGRRRVSSAGEVRMFPGWQEAPHPAMGRTARWRARTRLLPGQPTP